MIAPLREDPTPQTAPRPHPAGMRRARKWIVRTLLTVHSAEPPTQPDKQKAWLAATWISIVAAAFLGHLLLDYWRSR